MSDIFLSYAKEDREWASVLAAALEELGWSVFWERSPPLGTTWRDFIRPEIREARCIIVVWSAASVESDWALEEAYEGRRRRILVPVLVEDVEPPFGFGTLQALDLREWEGSRNDPGFKQLVSEMARLVGPARRGRRMADVRAESNAEAEEGKARQLKEDPSRDVEGTGEPQDAGHVFISYDSTDKERVRPLVKVLEEQGWTVWWDRRIPPGRTFEEVIYDAIQEAQCILVIWTAASVESKWVRKEAAEGERRGILVPALFDDVEIPFAFRDIHAAGLVGYPESVQRRELQELLSAIGSIARQPARKIPQKAPTAAPETQPGPSPAREPRTTTVVAFLRKHRAAARVVLTVAVTLGALAIWRAFPGKEPGTPEPVQKLVGSAGEPDATQEVETLAPGLASLVKITGTTSPGSGFVVAVDDNLATVVTASHVIAGTPRFRVFFAAAPQRPFEVDSQSLIGIQLDELHGLAAFRVRGEIPDNVVPVSLDTDTQLEPGGGRPLVFWGYPTRSLGARMMTGFFSGYEGILIVVDRSVGEGTSGGLLMLDGRVLGLVTAADPLSTYAVRSAVVELALEGWGVELSQAAR